ncbi:serpin family protein [Streptomonospora litoralis]|uniref:Serpin (Serine protease inhibitor) n=1 Tax=Streptomonospora litoralis TaxID=2498135 RepID=A0A4V0ZJU8_9ACTN|nr:serpin family protein [Streptomonospora litoralis]QBI54732.1 Serpin (serine protease inhibitor) [Streptomonospora litoralis]
MTVSLRTEHVDFALRVNTALAEAGLEERAWSPLSVAAALGLVATGARGATRREFEQLLGRDLGDHLAALDHAAADAPELTTSTTLWVRRDLPVLEEFETAVRARPASSVRTGDFAGDPDGVRREANGEVAELTRGMIEELLRPGDIRSSTQALLLNALWVRLRWSAPFDTDATARKPFHTPSGTRRVPMMRRRERRPYAKAAGWRMATLPADDDLALDVLLPDDPDQGTAPDPKALSALYRAASPTDVDLSLPRFEVRSRTPLSTTLADAGVSTVFTDRADLSGVAERPLRIDEVVHEAVLRVDEKGAEGAAATAVVMRTVAAVTGKPVRFAVDRPFAFVVRRRSAILFLGSVTAPQDPGPAEE